MLRVSFLSILAFAAISSAEAKVERVLLISVDGMRGDFLQTIIETAPQEVPNFIRLRNMGASTFNARTCHTWSYTVGNHLSMVTSRPVQQAIGLPNTAHHGMTNNSPPPGFTVHADGNPQVPYKKSIFDVVHDRGGTTAAFFHKATLNVILTSYDGAHGAPDVIGPDNGTNKIDIVRTPDGFPPTPALVATIEAGQMATFTMLHVAEVDLAGHGWGWTVAEGSAYRNAVHLVDGYLGSILDAIQARPEYATTTAIVLVADHGGGDGELFNHGLYMYLGNVTIPFILVAPGIAPETDAYRWFENRFNPGTDLPSYISPTQPLRNVDSGNLVAALLGLPAIPGSVPSPLFKRPVKVERAGLNVVVSWPLYLTGYTLERTDDLASGEWETITVGVTEVNGQWRYVEPISPTQRRMYRLRGP